MLTEIKKLFTKYKSISLYDLSLHFEMEALAMQQMLEIWIKKGKLEKKDLSCLKVSCAGCVKNNCEPSKMIFYERRDL